MKTNIMNKTYKYLDHKSPQQDQYDIYTAVSVYEKSFTTKLILLVSNVSFVYHQPEDLSGCIVEMSVTLNYHEMSGKRNLTNIIP
jgi:hypothetical protein